MPVEQVITLTSTVSQTAAQANQPTASSQEILWMIIILIGLTAAVYNGWLALRDDRARIRRGINGARKIATRQEMRHQLERTLILSGFVLIDVYALQAPPPVRVQISAAQAATIIVVTFAVMTLVTNSILDSYDRRRFNSYFERQEAAAARAANEPQGGSSDDASY